MRLYHFTTAEFGLSNVALQRLKISRLADLNDPFELLAANLVNPQHRRAFENLKNELSEETGMICFSNAWSNPLLWGHYANKHTGIALGFDVPDQFATEVLYTSQRVKIPIDNSTKTLHLDEKIVNRLLRTKFSDWKYEHEFRVFVELSHNTRESGMYFKEFSKDLELVEIILGPRCELPINRIRSLVESKAPKVNVLKARMGLSKFRAVEDRSFRRQHM